MAADFVERIEDLLGECVDAAVDAGWDGLGREQYAFTVADLDWIVGELGRKPTADEWESAGLASVGGRHVATAADVAAIAALSDLRTARVVVGNGLRTVAVAALDDAQVSQALDVIGQDTADVLRERLHNELAVADPTPADARAWLAAYAVAYEAAHGTPRVLW